MIFSCYVMWLLLDCMVSLLKLLNMYPTDLLTIYQCLYIYVLNSFITVTLINSLYHQFTYFYIWQFSHSVFTEYCPSHDLTDLYPVLQPSYFLKIIFLWFLFTTEDPFPEINFLTDLRLWRVCLLNNSDLLLCNKTHYKWYKKK